MVNKKVGIFYIYIFAVKKLKKLYNTISIYTFMVKKLYK